MHPEDPEVEALQAFQVEGVEPLAFLEEEVEVVAHLPSLVVEVVVVVRLLRQVVQNRAEEVEAQNLLGQVEVSLYQRLQVLLS